MSYESDTYNAGYEHALDVFDITPQQYHAGLDKLWKALGIISAQDEDVFTLAAKAITETRDECPYCPQLAAEIKRYHASNAALLEACESMVANINSWLATGVPADAQESEILYSQMVRAIAKAKGES